MRLPKTKGATSLRNCRRRNLRYLCGWEVSQKSLSGRGRSWIENRTELLLGNFGSVMSKKLERTSLYEHRIETDNAKLVRSLLIGCHML